MRKWKLFGSLALTATAVSFLVFRVLPMLSPHAPTYDWQCARCQYHFRQPVENAAADLAVIVCPKCKEKAAEREMHFQCRRCWKHYNLRGSQATLAHIVCPGCGSRAARDLDHSIPGDDQPIEGGQPYPGK